MDRRVQVQPASRGRNRAKKLGSKRVIARDETEHAIAIIGFLRLLLAGTIMAETVAQPRPALSAAHNQMMTNFP